MSYKNIQIIAFSILVLAVLGLYVLFFQNKSKSPAVNLNPTSKDIASASGRVVFVNTDTFFDKYNDYKKIENELKASQTATEKNLQGRMKALENDYMKLMQQAQGGQINAEQAQKKEQEILARRSTLEKEGQASVKSLTDRMEKATNSLYKTLQEYFSENKEKYNADVVMGYQTNGAILYFDPSLDITNQVIEDLNKK